MAKVFKYSPRIRKNKENGVEIIPVFEGFIEIEIPNYKERIDLIDKSGLSKEDGTDGIKALAKAGALLSVVSERIKSVNLKFIETGEEFKDFESLSCTKEGSEFINELGGIIYNGIPLAKN